MWWRVLQNALLEHSAILLTFIKLPFVFKTFVLSSFEWPLKTGFTVVSLLPNRYDLYWKSSRFSLRNKINVFMYKI